MKASEIREMSVEELELKLADLKEEIEVIFYASPLDAAKKALGVD